MMDEFAPQPTTLRRSRAGDETAPARPTALPTARDLLSALFGRHAVDHPLVRWACQLAEIHQAQVGGGRGDPVPRGDLVHEIDMWVELHVPQHRLGPVLHTETLGTVIDHIAATQNRIQAELSGWHGPDGLRLHAAWHRLAELVDSYDDLVRDVVRGARRLPAPARGG
ncbi:DUF4254 domain-containing protein [Nocardia brasiliensis]|uniref:DUF4254 domain-containing protein n=1 Tax=Nocardia brasiliensis TaxID=37326 RepID=UPI003D8C270A